ncbi:MAG: glycosyltransferase family 39 protein [Nanoarchaeota archaeon]|nr:glycosyltransferase family 39 protein [Nanoarchaeota archaeon]
MCFKKLKNMDKGILFLIITYIIITPFLLTPWIHSNDGVGYYSYLRSAVIDKDINLENEYEHYTKIFPEIGVKISKETGRTTNQYLIGTAILWSPFYLLAHIISRGDGYGYLYVLFVTFASSLYAFLGLILIYNFLRKYFDKFTSTLSVAIIWFATPVLFYMYLQPSLSHAISMFIVTAFLYYFFNTIKNRNIKQWIVLGILAALMTLVRHQNVLFLSVLAIEVIPYYYKAVKKPNMKKIKDLLSKHLLSALAFTILFVPQFIVWNINGFSLISSDKIGLFRLFFRLFGVTERGLFIWTPIAIFSLIGLFLFWKKQKEVVKYLTVGFIAQLIILNFVGGGYHYDFGQRRLVNCTFIFAVGLAYLIAWLNKKGWKQWLLVLVGLLFVAWNLGLIVQFGSRMIPAGKDITLLQMIKNNIIEVPKKAIGIIKGFLFNRMAYLKP